ncbi:MAG: MMPL family transporter [Nitrobacter sp.]|uniref:MMPL family transporter n=1 Tax=Nitrobacter sp. TaxID=29420 RepID=UPI0026325A44|nr:MMPL family transporter [Nitrobacter sp.]MCV0387857.1 MMPL family transporter [Nitrobacter sp.]
MGSRTNGRIFFLICAKIAQRWPWITLAVALVLTAAAGYATSRLTINTSTQGIIARNVEFLRTAREYERVFPTRGRPIIAIIDTPSEARTRKLVERFAEKLRNRKEAISGVEIPGSEEFFHRNALLFANTEQLRAFRQRIDNAGPLLSVLLADPNLRGVSTLVKRIGRAAAAGRTLPPEVNSILGAMANTTAARADGGEQVLSWSSALGLEDRGRQETAGIVLAYPHLDHSSLDPAQPSLAAVRSTFAEVAADGDASMRLTGEPVLREQELDAAFSGALYASLLSFVLVALTLMIGIRSWRVILALLATLIIGSIWTSGLAAITVRELNLISLAFMVLFVGLGVDFGTHLALRQMELAGRGVDTSDATRRAITGEGPAILLSVICASIGFLSFLPTDYLGLAELGIISALGMLVAAVITLILLPALLTLMPPQAAPLTERRGRLAGFIQGHAGMTLVVAALVTLGAGALATQIRIDVNPLHLQDPDTEAVRAYRDLASRPQLSPYALNIAAPNLGAARDLVRRLEVVPGVQEARSIDDLVPEDQDEKRSLISAIARGLPNPPGSAQQKPDSAELRQSFDELHRNVEQLTRQDGTLAASFDALANALESFAAKRGTNEPALRALDAALTGSLPELAGSLRQAATSARQNITIDDVPYELKREWLASDGRARVRVLPTDNLTNTEDLKAFAQRVQAVAPDATGVPVTVTEAAEVVRYSFLEAIAITAVAIAIILAILRRRLSDVILIMIPLVLAAVWTVAGAVLLGLPFNFANIIVIPLLLGLGVASSIHVVVRARDVASQQTADTVLETSTAGAVLLTDANTAGAFVTLAISAHRGLSSMGILLGLSIMLSLAASLIVLPAILEFMSRRAAR